MHLEQKYPLLKRFLFSDRSLKSAAAVMKNINAVSQFSKFIINILEATQLEGTHRGLLFEF